MSLISVILAFSGMSDTVMASEHYTCCLVIKIQDGNQPKSSNMKT